MDTRFSGPRNLGHHIKDRHNFFLTEHAQQRMQERNISPADVSFICRNGLVKQGKSHNIILYIPETPFVSLMGKRAMKLIGCEVVVSRDGSLITVLRKGA